MRCLRSFHFGCIHFHIIADLFSVLFTNYLLLVAGEPSQMEGSNEEMRGLFFLHAKEYFVSLSFVESSVGLGIFKFSFCPTCVLAAGDLHHREEAVPWGGPTFLHLVGCFERKGC